MNLIIWSISFQNCFTEDSLDAGTSGMEVKQPLGTSLAPSLFMWCIVHLRHHLARFTVCTIMGRRKGDCAIVYWFYIICESIYLAHSSHSSIYTSMHLHSRLLDEVIQEKQKVRKLHLSLKPAYQFRMGPNMFVVHHLRCSAAIPLESRYRRPHLILYIKNIWASIHARADINVNLHVGIKD